MNILKTTQKHVVSVFGENYVLTSDESIEHINRTVTMVDSLMAQISQKGQIVQPHRIAVLAAIQLASKNVHFDEHCDQLLDLVSKI